MNMSESKLFLLLIVLSQALLVTDCIASASIDSVSAADGKADSPCDINNRAQQDGAIMNPGGLSIIFEEAFSGEEVNSFLAEYGLSSLYSENSYYLIEDEDGNAVQGPVVTSYIVDVDKGHEAIWMEILSQSKHVKDICRYPVRTAGVDVMDIYISAASAGEIASGQVKDRLSPKVSYKVAALEYLKEYYNLKGDFILLKDLESALKVKVSNMRGEIFRAKKYWEELTVNIVFVDGDDKTELYMFVDARYAAGLGNKPPASQNFKYVDKTNEVLLRDYSSALLTHIKQRFESI